MQKPVEKPIKFIKNLATKGKSYPITHASAVIDDNGESIKSTIDSLKNKSSITKVTWKELKDKRDAGKLIPGSLYRITDYNCTTTQENTQSAGHQFDIVLLALSENKLAEEGWAMMNDNIYDVTFNDGVIKRCYIYPNRDDDGYDLAVVGEELTKGYGALVIGDSFDDADLILNQEAKSAMCSQSSSGLGSIENISYNYFQNSNLSAWKVWYCLDNDTARFAWADDSEDEDSPASIMVERADNIFVRDYTKDQEEEGTIYYGWYDSDNNVSRWTTSQEPNVGDTTYINKRGFIEDNPVTSYTPAHKGTGLPNGRGVIYRLIDEWGNDVGYDFKNIQFLVKIDMETGYYDGGGDDTYVYSLNAWIDGVIMDASIIGNTLQNDVGIIDMVANNVIKTEPPVEDNAKGYYLPFNVVLTSNEDGDGYYGVNDVNFSNYSKHNIVTSPCRAIHFNGICSENVIFPNVYVTFINCANMTEQNSYSGLYLNNKKVLTEE